MSYLQITLSCIVLMFFRAGARLYYVGIWAEDGKTFLTEGLRWGLSSLTIPHAGSYHTLQRLIALFTIQVIPVPGWAHWLNLLNLTIVGIVSARIAHSDYEWLFPSHRLRRCLAFLLCLTPGLNEMGGNLANLNWILFMWLGLLALRDPARSLRPWEAAAATIAIFSVGTSILLLPLFLWRAAKTRKWGDAALLLILCAQNAWLVYLNTGHVQTLDALPQNPRATPLSEIIFTGFPILVQTFNKSVVFRPWVGPGFATKLTSPDRGALLRFITLTLTCGTYLYFASWFWKRRRESAAQALFLFAACLFFWPALRFVGRTGAIGDVMYLNGNYWSLRFSYPLGFLAPLLWTSVFKDQPFFRKRVPSCLTVFLFLGFLHGLDRFWLVGYEGRVHNWPASAGLVEKAIQEKGKVRAPIAPWGDDWYIEIP